jgi:hypothetical protein
MKSVSWARRRSRSDSYADAPPAGDRVRSAVGFTKVPLGEIRRGFSWFWGRCVPCWSQFPRAAGRDGRFPRARTPRCARCRVGASERLHPASSSSAGEGPSAESGSQSTRLEPALRRWVDPPGDGGRNPRNAPACKNEEHVMRGRGVSKICFTNNQDDSPHQKAANGIRPVVAVLRHVVLPILPARPGGLSPCSADRRSSSVRSESLTGLTIAQWLPTGQRWYRVEPSRIEVNDPKGDQIVVKTWPLLHRTMIFPPSTGRPLPFDQTTFTMSTTTMMGRAISSGA